MIAWLLAPLAYQFMQRGMIVAVLVGVVCAVVGCYVVLRSMAFIGDAMAHSILPGVAVAYVVKGNLLIGALAAAVAVALGVGFFSRQGRLKEDSAIGILFAAAFSLGIILISSIRTYAVDLSHILFGNVLGVSTSDLLLTAGLVVIVLLAVFLLYKELLVVSFDPVLAATLRLPAERLRTVLLVLLALTVVVSLQSVGIGLVTSMLVTPSAAAYLLTRRLPRMIALSALIGGIVEYNRAVCELLSECRIRRRHCAHRDRVFSPGLPVCPEEGVAWEIRPGRREKEEQPGIARQ